MRLYKQKPAGVKTMVELIDIYKKFNPATVNETVLFNGFNFSLKKGDFLSIVGSNGSGKTTLLNLIGGSILPDSGKIMLDGKDITTLKEFKRSAKIGRVFQDPSKGVSPNMTIFENLALAENKGNLYGLSAGFSKKKTDYYKSLLAPLGLGLEDTGNVKMGSLSGGQRQSVAIIMATLTPIDLLLLDEHTAALDPKTADKIMEFTNQVVKEKNLTAAMVTHNLRYAVEYGNRLMMMHEGSVVLDIADEKKQSATVDDLLGLFNTISIECGN